MFPNFAPVIVDSISNQMVTRLGHTVVENKVNNSFFRLEFYIFS